MGMRARYYRRSPAELARLEADPEAAVEELIGESRSSERSFRLDKGWQALNFLLTGKASLDLSPSRAPIEQVVSGARESARSREPTRPTSVRSSSGELLGRDIAADRVEVNAAGPSRAAKSLPVDDDSLDRRPGSYQRSGDRSRRESKMSASKATSSGAWRLTMSR